MFEQKTYTLTDIANKAISWFNNLTPNQQVGLTLLAVLILAENTPQNVSYNYYSNPKPLPRKNFSDLTKRLAKFGQFQVCNRCKRPTDLWEYHHRDGNRSNNRLENCEALCSYCHAKITRNGS